MWDIEIKVVVSVPQRVTESHGLRKQKEAKETEKTS